MKVTLTGASGRLGGYTCRTLVERGHVVRATDKVVGGDLPVKVQVADLLNREVCYDLLDGADAVIHLGNHTHYRGYDAQTVFNENVTMNMNVFQAAADLKVKQIVFASSIHVISNEPSHRDPAANSPPYLPLDSAAPPKPGNVYGLSKQVSEVMLDYFARCCGMSCVAVRFPYLMDDRALQRVKAREWQGAIREEAFSFLHYQDAALLLEAILRANLPAFRAYFAASPDNTLFKPAAEVIRRHFADVPLRKPLDQIASLVDISIIEQETGWTPKFGSPS